MSSIVVGIDGSPGSTEALRWAVEEARIRDATLVAMMAWELPLTMIPPEGAWTESVNWDSAREEATAVLAGTVAAVDTEGVEVQQILTEGPAVHALLNAGEEADLLVVGSRGRGGFVALVLGSVSSQVAHHASCPVVIVPSTGED